MRKPPFDDVELPESVIEPILLRARFHGIIDTDIEDETILGYTEFTQEFESNISQMMSQIPEAEEQDQDTLLKNLFGYLFAKAVEMKYSNSQQNKMLQTVSCNYSPTDAWEGIIHSNLKPEEHLVLEDAFDLGRQFYKDFKFFQEYVDDDSYDDNLSKALMTVQNLGCFYSQKCFAQGAQKKSKIDECDDTFSSCPKI